MELPPNFCAYLEKGDYNLLFGEESRFGSF